MPLTRTERRISLARVRGHLQRALDDLPEDGLSVQHFRLLLPSMVRSIDEQIGTEPEGGPVRDHDCELPDVGVVSNPDPERDWHTSGAASPKDDPMPSERALAEGMGWPARHARGEC